MNRMNFFYKNTIINNETTVGQILNCYSNVFKYLRTIIKFYLKKYFVKIAYIKSINI